jgi:hypothetical protein
MTEQQEDDRTQAEESESPAREAAQEHDTQVDEGVENPS